MATQNSINNTSGGILVTGTANINTTGSAISSIGTGGTGATNIGNATGNTTVTGSLTATTTLTATSGNITATNGSISVGATAAAATAQDVDFLKSRSGGVITTGDTLGIVTFKGHDGTGYITASQIQSVNSGTVATNRIASNLLFYTHPDSTTASMLRMTIASTGAVTIASPDSGTGLTVSGGGATVTSGAITATSGNVVITAGNITLPTSTSSALGNIVIGGVPIMHAYGTQNIFIGPSVGNYTMSGSGNEFIGYDVGTLTTTGNTNNGFGYSCLAKLTTGIYNVAQGANSLHFLTTGQYNTALGIDTLYSLTTGSYNTCIGVTPSGNYGAGSNYTSSEGSNICISNLGTAGESHVIRIGTQGSGNGQQNKAFMAGIYNTAVGATSNVTLVDSAGQLGGLAGSANTVFMGGTAPSFTGSPSISGSLTAGTGITVTAGGITFTTTGTNGITSIDTFGRTIGVSGVPVLVDNTGLFGTVASSKRFKHDIKDMADSSDILMKLRPVMFTYNENKDGARSPGLIAEEVADVMPDLVSYDKDGAPYTVKYNDLPAMLLNEIQKLRKRIEILEAKNGI